LQRRHDYISTGPQNIQRPQKYLARTQWIALR